MSNKRIVELAEILPVGITDSDLFVVEDVSIPETKKITAANLVDYVSVSASLNTTSASYASTSSFLNYVSGANTTASYAITSSHAISAYSSSYVISSSFATSASYAVSSSYTSSHAESSNTASFLAYSNNNGTASYAITSSISLNSNTASYINWLGGTSNNGTVFNSISSSHSLTASFLNAAVATATSASYASTASLAVTASWLKYTGANNGTSSHAITAGTATTAGTVTTITHERLFREYGPFTSSILGTNTASFGYCQITKSDYTTYNRVIAEVCGDIKINSTSSATAISLLTLNAYDNVFASTDLDLTSGSFHFSGSYMSASSALPTTGSIITSFYLRGAFNALPSPGNYLWTVKSTPGIQFYTSSRPVTMQLKLNTDSVSGGQVV